MFINIKDQLDNPVVRKIMAESVFDNSPEAMDYKAEEFRKKSGWFLYGWVENGEIKGVCGFEVHSDWVEILNIAVLPDSKKLGFGSAMITSLKNMYNLPIEAETDDDAVDFYRKYGFKATAVYKYNIRRWVCVLPV